MPYNHNMPKPRFLVTGLVLLPCLLAAWLFKLRRDHAALGPPAYTTRIQEYTAKADGRNAYLVELRYETENMGDFESLGRRIIQQRMQSQRQKHKPADQFIDVAFEAHTLQGEGGVYPTRHEVSWMPHWGIQVDRRVDK